MNERLDRNLPYLPSLVVYLRTVLAQGKSERIAVDGLQLSISSTITTVLPGRGKRSGAIRNPKNCESPKKWESLRSISLN